MLRIIQQLIEMRVRLMFGRELTKRDRSIVWRHSLKSAQDILKIMDETANKIVVERISKRHDRKGKEVHTYFSTRPEWELPRREGDDRLGDD